MGVDVIHSQPGKGGSDNFLSLLRQEAILPENFREKAFRGFDAGKLFDSSGNMVRQQVQKIGVHAGAFQTVTHLGIEDNAHVLKIAQRIGGAGHVRNHGMHTGG